MRDVGPPADVIDEYLGDVHLERRRRRRHGPPVGLGRGPDRADRAARRAPATPRPDRPHRRRGHVPPPLRRPTQPIERPVFGSASHASTACERDRAEHAGRRPRPRQRRRPRATSTSASTALLLVPGTYDVDRVARPTTRSRTRTTAGPRVPLRRRARRSRTRSTASCRSAASWDDRSDAEADPSERASGGSLRPTRRRLGRARGRRTTERRSSASPALGELDWPDDQLEVIVVGSASGADAWPTTPSAPDRRGRRRAAGDRARSPPARNAACDAARGEYVAFLDRRRRSRTRSWLTCRGRRPQPTPTCARAVASKVARPTRPSTSSARRCTFAASLCSPHAGEAGRRRAGRRPATCSSPPRPRSIVDTQVFRVGRRLRRRARTRRRGRGPRLAAVAASGSAFGTRRRRS